MKMKSLSSGHKITIPTTHAERAFMTGIVKAHIRTLWFYQESEVRQRSESWTCRKMDEDGFSKLHLKIDLSSRSHAVSKKALVHTLHLRASVTFTDGEIQVWVQDERGWRASLEEYVRERVGAPYSCFDPPI